MASDVDNVIAVRLFNSKRCKWDGITKENLKNICGRFQANIVVYVCGTDGLTCLLFPDVDVSHNCELSESLKQQKNVTRISHGSLYCYIKYAGSSSIIRACSPKLFKRLVPRCQKPEQCSATCLAYDLSTDRFMNVQSDGPRVHISRKVQPHQVKSLAKERSCFRERPDKDIVVVTYPLERYPVQATHGPHESVEFDSPFARATRGGMAGLAMPEPPVPRPPCRNPDYADEHMRHQTFQGRWPHGPEVQDVRKMAKYGLYFTGPGDLVRCFQCGLGMKDWSGADDSLLEHFKYSPECPHLLREVDPSVLQAYTTRTNPQNVARDRHPEYSTAEARAATFTRWPRDLTQTPDVLVSAGFYYTGFEDRVRCYCCDGGLQHWDAEDDPWIEHARWFPQCRHVIAVKGDNYIRMVQLALQYPDSADEDVTSSDVATGTSASNVNDASGTARESDDVIYSPAAQSLITSLGFSAAAVRMAIQECKNKGTRWDSSILANVLLEKQERGEVLPTDPERPTTPPDTRIDVSTREGLQEERQRLLNRLRCLQCQERDANILFLPCAHRKLCHVCAQNVSTCPLCQKPVREKVKTYMA